MSQLHSTSVVFALLLASPAVAQDAGNGATLFEKQCASCHVVVNDLGETLAGHRARIGPNLNGVIGQAAGHDADFRYGPGLMAASDAGLTWDAGNFVAYLMNPDGFLRAFTGDAGARSKMAWKVRRDSEAADLFAFLASLD